MGALWAAQDGLELIDNLGLETGIVGGGLVVGITGADGNKALAATDVENISLPWEPGGSAVLGIPLAEQTSVDAGHDELEIAELVATAVRNGGEVDVQVGVGGQVRLSGVDDGGGDVHGKIGIDASAEGSGGVPSSAVTGNTRKGDGRDAGLLDGPDGSTDSAGEGNLDGDIAADVGSGKGKLRLSAVPELGSDLLDAILHAGNGERIDVVEARIGSVSAGRRASSGAGLVLAAISINSGWWSIKRAATRLVLSGTREDGLVAGSVQDVEEGAEVGLGPTIVVGLNNANTLGQGEGGGEKNEGTHLD